MRALGTGLVLAALAAPAAAHAGGAGTTQLASGVPLPAGATAGASSGMYGDGADTLSVSATGRYVAFASAADTLDPAAAGDHIHVFRKDRQTGAVTLIDRAAGASGAVAAADGHGVVLRADGHLAAWITEATLTPDDTDGGQADVYVRNLDTGTTTLATPGTTQYIGEFDLSGDGAYVAFATPEALLPVSDTNGKTDVYRRKLSDGSLTLISARQATGLAGNGNSRSPSISGNGAWVAYSSTATDLLPGFVDGNGSNYDVFARNASAAAQHLVSADNTNVLKGGNDDSTRPHIAGTPAALNQVQVAYGSSATNLAAGGVDGDTADSVYLRTSMAAAPSTLISRANGVAGANADSRAHVASISADGHRVTWASDAHNLNPNPDYYGVYVRDVTTSATTMISHDDRYAVASAISGDGTTLVWTEGGGFTADSEGDLAYVFARTYPSGAPSLVSRPAGSAPFLAATPEVGTGSSGVRAISADGRYVVFTAAATRLPAGDPLVERVYRRDLKTGATVLVSRADGASGTPSGGFNYNASMSDDGNVIAFEASGPLDAADTNGGDDAYVRNVSAGTTRLVSRADGAAGAGSNSSSGYPAVSGDGHRVAFLSTASNLGAGAGSHVYVRDLTSSHTIVVDRATGVAGAVGNNGSDGPSISDDGSRVAFTSQSTNLDPDDATNGTDVYLRDLTANTTMLLSRRSGLTGTKASSSSTHPAISGDGKVVAFRATDETLAPEAGAWPDDQIVRRVVAVGSNALVSRVAGGAPGNAGSDDPAVNRNGSVVVFRSAATNLLAGRGGNNRESELAWIAGVISGPPAFGFTGPAAGFNPGPPAISADGQCLAFVANGHNAITGPAGDFDALYVHTLSGNCPKPDPVIPPPALVKPVVTKLTMTHRTFRVSSKPTATTAAARKKKKKKKKPKSPAGTIFGFTLNTTADVHLTFARASTGRRVGKSCRKATHKLRKKKKCTRYTPVKGAIVRAKQGKGSRKLSFSGRIGAARLKPGGYRATVVATNTKGTSPKRTITFKVVAR